ncbi:unnamed protein product [Linum tenue]|uniref:Uncharacterized protein n=1 Tax=Linum tenue TaxID=586396 RepID=A0AAV0PIB7_9ROSI|nr:unnamed protein product [Linum tenue]
MNNPVNSGVPGPPSVPPSSSAATAAAPITSTSASTLSFGDDPSKKIRKPYTITKSRESWTEQEHDKFLEALQLFDRDWKRIEAFVGSKTVIQIRSHAQKYFLKVQKSGTSEHVPPPRPKRKASHPYPQKAPKIGKYSKHGSLYCLKLLLLENGYIYRPDSSSVLGSPMSGGALSSWNYYSMPQVAQGIMHEDDTGVVGTATASTCCYSSNNESTPRTWPPRQIVHREDQNKAVRVMPDFAQVYSFIGSVFDPSVGGHVEKLKQMDPINLETVMLLMKNLSFNLASPDFEDHVSTLSRFVAYFRDHIASVIKILHSLITAIHCSCIISKQREVLASHDPATERGSPYGNTTPDTPGSAIPAV